MDGIRNLFRKKLKDGGPSGEGGHQNIDPNDLPLVRKPGWLNVMDGPDAGDAARKYIADQKIKRQNSINEYYRNLEKNSVPKKNVLAEIRKKQKLRNHLMMNQGGVASMFRKKLEDGDLSPEIISQIESMAATGADASTISALVGVSEEQVNNVLMSGSTSEVMPVEGEEMVETAEVTEEADPLLNLFQQNDSLNNDQAITTLFAQQEPQGIMASKGGLTNYLKENAPKGEFLAYINPDEATMLKRAGGSGKLVNGIPSFEPRSSREADQKSGKTGSGDGGYTGPNMADIAGPVTAPSTKTETKTETKPDARDKYISTMYTTGPKTRNKTITGTITKGPKAGQTYTYTTPVSYQDYNKKDLFSSRTGFGPKGKDTWHEAALKSVPKSIKEVDRSLNPSPFSLLDVVLTIGSMGLINPAVTKVAKTISNVRTGLKVADLVSDPTKTKSVKDMVKDVLTKTAKNEISKKTGIDVKTIDTTLDTIEKALDTEIGKAVVDKFNSFNTKNKNTTKNNTNKTTTFNGGDNDGPLPNIIPVVPELIAEEVIVEEPETSLFSVSNLNRIRDRQNRRRSFFANRGGLAGLFRVKNQ